MKKSLFLFAVLLLGVLAITSCDSNDDDVPVVTPVVVSHGAFVACAGNMASHISGSLSYYDYKASSVTNNAFLQANGRQLGGTVNDGLAYGSKIYLVATDENSIEVVDKTLHSIHHISTTALLGNADGKSPRHLAADGGRIYFTTYGGYVGAIDTTSFALQDKFKVGSYPEGVTIANGRIFVANSDYGNGNGSISEINMASQQVIDHKISDIVNPQKVYVVRGNIYVLDWGSYGTTPPYAQTGAGLKRIVVENGRDVAKTVVENATLVAQAENRFYTVNAPYGASAVSYNLYDAAFGSKVTLPYHVDSPAAIAVDPTNGHVFLSSYVLNGGYADYNANGYLQEYDVQGTALQRYTVGVGPTAIFFNTAR